VRNVYYTWLRENPAEQLTEFDEDLVRVDPYLANQEEVLVQNSSGAMLRSALETLPARSREMLILRELEGMSYKDISAAVGVPTGTVMSTLSRARARLRRSVINLMSTWP
jgi:RNA polymerase sigma factor (sigma-70 family)